MVFLSPEVFRDGEDGTRWIPVEDRGKFGRRQFTSQCFKEDNWAKRHAIFDGLPNGGMMDPIWYRQIIPSVTWETTEVPAEAVSGTIHTSFLVQRYSSGLFVSVHELGAGQFILNTLSIREHLGEGPVAERLLRNMLVYAVKKGT